MKYVKLALILLTLIPLFQGCKQPEKTFSELTQAYNVIIMKHCYPSSDVLSDTGTPDPSSPRQSIENYKAVYRLLRDKFDRNPDTLFIMWTPPPRHRLFEPAEGDKNTNAARATEFSDWMMNSFLLEGGVHPNIFIWDFRKLIMDPATNFLKYEFELNHNDPNSHPNNAANNFAGPQFARFIVDSVKKFYGSKVTAQNAKIVFLHHSTGGNLYNYKDLGVSGWIKNYNQSNNLRLSISDLWYPAVNNMPADYYNSWLK